MSNKIAIDLFAGAGGLSLGFKNAAFEIPCTVEVDAWAADTYEYNNKHNVIREDIGTISDNFFTKWNGADVVMGGPPCQGFSIAASNRRDPSDPRNALYRHFLRAVAAIKPSVVLLENVKEILSTSLPNGTKIIDDIVLFLEDRGYKVAYGIINAKYIGIPQDRLRFFLIASRKRLPCLNEFLSETNYDLNLWDAISDLPPVKPGSVKDDQSIKYKKPPQNSYQTILRNGSDQIFNHVSMRHTPRLIERFKSIRVGGNLADVNSANGAYKRGAPGTFSGRVYHQNHRRLSPSKPSRTITASFYSSFIFCLIIF